MRLGKLILAVTIVVAAVPVALAIASVDPGKLPPDTLRGPAHRLNQYPTVSLATDAQRAAAIYLRATAGRASLGWRDPRDADAAGFDTAPARRRAPGSVGILHAEHRGYRNDGRYLDPRRPETLVYANVPGRPLVLIGVMFSMPRALHGPTPGGPITRWHTHRVCVRDRKRGLAPRADGSCPPGARSRQGSEMLHLWFTRDLRSAFAIHAPEHELCIAGLLPPTRCLHSKHQHRM